MEKNEKMVNNMQKEELICKLKLGVSHIHDDIFDKVEVNEVINEEDQYLKKALDKYAQYFNYAENTEKYNLKYCFKTTINDLNRFYEYQEKKLEQLRSDQNLCDLEHKVNEHIYDEVILCQKKVNRLFTFNMVSSYFIAFLLIFSITEFTHLFEFGTLLGSTVLAGVMALVKIVIDKKYLEVVRQRIGWKSYRIAIKRSLAFYFASLIIINQTEHESVKLQDQDKVEAFKNQVREAIDILLEEIIV